jgi:methylated-DNA-[protein]-cysteine S-methyltransferase
MSNPEPPTISLHAVPGLGLLAIATSARGLRGISFTERGDPGIAGRMAPAVLAKEVASQLTAYAKGTLRTFDLPLDLTDCTPFTQVVLTGCARIPWGSTTTYAGLAATIGRPGAFRAVGSALGRNPVPIVVPCHRVVAACGIGGFTGGLAIKRMLGDIEGIGYDR